MGIRAAGQARRGLRCKAINLKKPFVLTARRVTPINEKTLTVGIVKIARLHSENRLPLKSRERRRFK
jgi:hypothetical protein